MAVLHLSPGVSNDASELIELLGIPPGKLRELHIHFVLNDIVVAEASYLLNELDEEDKTKLKTILKRYKLVEIKEKEK